MDPRLVNGLVALTGIAAAVAAIFSDADTRLELGAYACTTLGYCIKRYGDLPHQPEIERGAP